MNASSLTRTLDTLGQLSHAVRSSGRHTPSQSQYATGACVALELTITDSVGVAVQLVRVCNVDAVVALVANRVSVAVGGAPRRLVRANVAPARNTRTRAAHIHNAILHLQCSTQRPTNNLRVAKKVTVSVGLGRIRRGQTVVTPVTHAVAIRVGLVDVVHVGAVVHRVALRVAVRVDAGIQLSTCSETATTEATATSPSVRMQHKKCSHAARHPQRFHSPSDATSHGQARLPHTR